MAKKIEKQIKKEKLITVFDYIDSLQIPLQRKNILKLTHDSKELKTYLIWKTIINL